MRIAPHLARPLAVATASVLALGVLATSASASTRAAIAVNPAPATIAIVSVSDDTDAANQLVTVTGTAAPGAGISLGIDSSSPWDVQLSPTAPITTTPGGTWTASFDATALNQGIFYVTATSVADGTTSAPVTANKDTLDFALLRTSPSAAGVGATSGPLVAEFNESVDAASSTFTLADGGTAAIPAALPADVPGSMSATGLTGSALTFTPGQPLEVGHLYTATVHAVESGVGHDAAIDTTFTYAVDAGLPGTPTLSWMYPYPTVALIYGSAPANANVVLTASDSATPAKVTTQSLQADGAGNFSSYLDLTALGDGAVTIVATTTAGPDGPVSNPSNTLGLTKNSAPNTISDLAATDTSPGSRIVTITGRASRPGSSLSGSLSDGNGASKDFTGATDADGTFAIRTDSDHVKNGLIQVAVSAYFAPDGSYESAYTSFTNGSSVGPGISDQKATDSTRQDPFSLVTGVTTPGAVVTVTTDYPSTITGSATADGAGAFSVRLDETGMPTSTVHLHITAALPGGPVGPRAVLYSNRVNGPTISHLVATPVTSDTPTSTISGDVGAADAGATISFDIYYNTAGGSQSASAVAGLDGAFSVDVNLSDFADGYPFIFARATDTNGGVGPYAYAGTQKDTVRPQVTDLVATSTTTNSPSSVITGGIGSGLGSTSVAITAVDHLGASTETSGYAYDSGSYSSGFSASLDLSGLADGPVTITATPTDDMGNTGTPVQTTATKDTVGPAVTDLAATPTKFGMPSTTVTGSTLPGAQVLVSAAEGDYSTSSFATADDTGAFTTQLDLSGFPDGPVPVTAVATDPGNGNVGPSADTTSLRHTAGPAITDLAATAVTLAVHGSTVTGSTAPGATVAIAATDAAANTVNGTATADGTGAFSTVLDLGDLVAGDVTVTAAATDADGATGALATTTTTTEGPAVTITTQPESQTTPSGTSVTFTAAGVGTPTPTVQWQRSTNHGDSFADIPGATDPSLNVTPDYSDTGYEYRAVFTNVNGAATTGAAVLTVTPTAPVVMRQPADQTVAPGSVAMFHADAVGDPMPTVRWQVSQGGSRYSDIEGATSKDYVVAASSTMSGDRYRAVFTNDADVVVTSAAVLTVRSAPSSADVVPDVPTPPVVVSPTPTPSSSTPAARKTLTLSVLTPEIPAGSNGTLVATGAANEAYSLQCYTRPSTRYTEAKHGVFNAAGDPVKLTLSLARNTRCFVQYANDSSQGASNSAVVQVRTVLSLSAAPAGTRTLVFRGSNLPRVAGQLITLYRVDAAGHEIRSAAVRTDSTGVFHLTRRFTGAGVFTFKVRTTQGLSNAAGSSSPIRVTIG